MLLQSFGTVTPNVVAACQHLAIAGCVYADDRSALETLLGSDGEILAFERGLVTWPPALAIVRTSAGDYHACFEGTTNLVQATTHLWGSFQRLDYFPPCTANGAWLAGYQVVQIQVDQALPPNLPPGKLHISGHSYGGAMAFLGALHQARDRGSDAVELLTFGEPRALTAGYPGVQPACHWRYASELDPVQILPPDSSLIPATDWADPLRWAFATPTWKHYGTLLTLYPGGTINREEPPPNPLPPGVTVGGVNEHLLRNYWGRLQAWNRRFGA